MHGKFFLVLLCVMSQYRELNLEINKSISMFGIREFVAASFRVYLPEKRFHSHYSTFFSFFTIHW